MSSCQDNGACDWKISRNEAVVTDIYSYDINENGDSLYRVVLKFDGSIYSKKEQFMDELRNRKFTKALIEKNKIRPGNIYKTTISEAISGNCKSPILSFDASIRE